MADPAKKSYEVRRIFIASPGDLIPERKAFLSIIEEVNEDVAKSKNILLEPVGWEDTLPGNDRAQELINQDLLTCDLIIMLLWKKWGTPSGKYSSGFEEEFRLACDEGKEIFLYFKDLPDDMLADPGDQLKKVLTFRDEIEQAKKPFFKRFADEQDWQKLLRNHICRWLDKLSPEIPAPEIAEYQQRIQELETKLAEAKTGQAKAALHLSEAAQAFADSGQITRAEESFAKAIALASSPWIINSYARFLLRIGSLGKAEDNLLRVSAIGQATGDKEILAAAYGNLGIIYKTRGELGKAEEIYKKALAINEELGRKEGLAANYCNLGLIYKTRGELGKAEEMYNEALAITKEIGHKEFMAANYCNLGLIYETRGETAKAEKMYNKSLAITKEISHKEFMANNYGNLGNIYETRGNLDKAEEMHKKACAINEELGCKKGLASNYGNLGNIYEDRGELDKAEEMYQKSLATAKELGNKEIMASNYCNLGVVNESRGEFDKAKELYKKSLAIFTELGSKLNIETVESNLKRLEGKKHFYSAYSKINRKTASTESSKKTPARRRSPKSKNPSA
jgi:tetratricopeptide (TPR) repeat protein